MLRTLSMLCCGVMALAAPARSQEERLAPRHVQIIGVELGGIGSITSDKYECLDRATNTIHRYRRIDRLFAAAVVSVRPGSPAESAGIRCGDMIVSANEQEVSGAAMLQAVISLLPENSEVKIGLRSPIPGETGEEAYIQVTLSETTVLTLKTVTLDRVAEQQKNLPMRTRELVDDQYGPLVNFVATSTFVEKTPGRIQYTCMLSHRGEQKVMPIESPILFMLGIQDAVVNMDRLVDRTISLEGDVAAQGIPTLTYLPLYVARAIDDKQVAPFIRSRRNATVGVLRDLVPATGDMYYWHLTQVRCYLPELLSQRIAAKIKRFNRIGINLQ